MPHTQPTPFLLVLPSVKYWRRAENMTPALRNIYGEECYTLAQHPTSRTATKCLFSVSV